MSRGKHPGERFFPVVSQQHSGCGRPQDFRTRTARCRISGGRRRAGCLWFLSNAALPYAPSVAARRECIVTCGRLSLTRGPFRALHFFLLHGRCSPGGLHPVVCACLDWTQVRLCQSFCRALIMGMVRSPPIPLQNGCPSCKRTGTSSRLNHSPQRNVHTNCCA